ncbi:kinase-like domain-containing protein, partial [Pisolithus marmoratus]
SESVHTIPSIPCYVPEELQGYHSLVPLEPITPERRKFVSWFSTVYRATSVNDGAAYVLRRIENFRLTHHAALGMIESWSRIRHPNIVRVREAFTTRAFNDNSLVVCYDYHPNSQSLMELYFRSMSAGTLHASMGRIPEATLWTYIIQIANAIRVAHEAGLAVRMIDPAKILLTGKNRLRINACGIVDVLLYDTRQDIGLAQQEDLVMFGRLVIALCCSSITALNALPKALEIMSRIYSPDIKTLALYLISKPGPHKTIAQVMELIGTNRLVHEMDEMQIANDRLEAELMGELENGRLVRLLCKFGFINERPEFAREPRWSETGDRYIIKLFRDYVFHQVDENGSPVVNLSHVLTCLNKLDCGSDERIMLVSRDEQSCLVVTYKEVKACIESAFSDLSRVSR